MERRGLLKALAGGCGLAVGACSFHASPLVAYTPSVWKAVAPNALAHYTLLGSVHQGFWRFYPLPKTIETAFEQSEGLLVELESQRRYSELVQRFSPLVRQPSGRRLQDEIGAELMERLTHVLRADHAQIQRLQTLRPWAVSLELQSPADTRLQVETRQGLDAYFLESAYRRKKPVIELETVEEQVHALSGGSSAEQTALLEDAIKTAASWNGVLDAIIEAWRAGDDQRMAQLQEKHFPSTGPFNTYRERMLNVRDSTMAQRLLEHSLATGGTATRRFFVLVGAMHLVGPRNLLEQLQRLGFSVSREQSRSS